MAESWAAGRQGENNFAISTNNFTIEPITPLRCRNAKTIRFRGAEAQRRKDKR